MKQFVYLLIFVASVLTMGCKRSVQDIVEETKKATVTIYTYDE